MLPVYYEEQLVGSIAKEGPGLSFTYSESWAAAAAAFAISTTMPIREEPYAANVATPWFANLLPEDRQLEKIGRLLGRDQGDVYGLLEEIGRDTAGALSIGGEEGTDNAKYRELNESELADVIDRLPARPMLAGEPEVTMSLAGAQTKLTVAIFDDKIHLPLGGAASTHILKPASQRLFASVENELLCMRVAAATGVAVAHASAGKVSGRSFLLVERYDRTIANGRVTRHHQEDFCQALGRYPTEKYEAGGGPNLRDLFQTIDEVSRQPARDRLALLDLVILACCFGDNDRHAKNYSLLLRSDGVRLTDGYDLLSALTYDGITPNIAMRIAGKNRAEHIQRRHWERFASEVGLAPAATARRVSALAARTAELTPRVARALSEEYPVDTAALTLFSDVITRRAEIIGVNSRRDTHLEEDTDGGTQEATEK
jgi:serine/threonine-protein kinase HipA